MKSNIRKYTFSSSDNLFFDANVLIYLDGPIANVNQKLQEVYANAFAKMITEKSNLFIDTTVISEFANRYLRFAYEPFRGSSSFKDFRDSSDGEKTISNICAILKRRLRYFSISSVCVNNTWLVGIIEEFDKLSGDFNDCIIADICRKNNLSLITHDGDMGSFDISTISANRKLYS